VYDEFVQKAKARALKRSVGDPFKVGIEQGPQVTYPHTQLKNEFRFFTEFLVLSSTEY